MAKFHAEWSGKIADVMIPYLDAMNADLALDPEKAEKNKVLLKAMPFSQRQEVIPCK